MENTGFPGQGVNVAAADAADARASLDLQSSKGYDFGWIPLFVPGD